MLFSSITFLYYFLPCVLILYYLVPKSVKNEVLLLASLVFYAWGEPVYLFLMLGTIIISYVLVLQIEKHRGTTLGKFIFITAIGIPLGFLIYFKYLGSWWRNIALPIGISFYTFQLISYIADVYMGRVKAQKNAAVLATYITMFPQLIAGPIVRYIDVESALHNREHTYEKIAYGIRRFVIGLSKKVLIANVLGEFCGEFRMTDDKSVLFYWAYAAAVSLQLYFDFSGYSDMAIGLGSMLGFEFMENFNYPFIAKSITEFWRRWHISLSSWFRDYVYIPLGGSRCSRRKNLRNILIVWALTGIWHGAGLNFLIWGLLFASFLILEKLFLLEWLKQHPRAGHLYTIVIVCISFVVFSAQGVGPAYTDIGGMFGINGIPFITQTTIYYLESYAIVFLFAVLGATPLVRNCAKKFEKYEWLEMGTVIALLFLSTAYLVDGSFNPFLYFRF